MRRSFTQWMICLAAGLPAVALAQLEYTALDVKAGGSKTFFMNNRVGNNQVTVFSESMGKNSTPSETPSGVYMTDSAEHGASFEARDGQITTGVPN